MASTHSNMAIKFACCLSGYSYGNQYTTVWGLLFTFLPGTSTITVRQYCTKQYLNSILNPSNHLTTQNLTIPQNHGWQSGHLATPCFHRSDNELLEAIIQSLQEEIYPYNVENIVSVHRDNVWGMAKISFGRKKFNSRAHLRVIFFIILTWMRGHWSGWTTEGDIHPVPEGHVGREVFCWGGE